MKGQPSSVRMAAPVVVNMYPNKLPARSSQRTFRHCLKALLANTEILAKNVVSLHLQWALETKNGGFSCEHLSDFHQDLAWQARELEREIGSDWLEANAENPSHWSNWADVWQIGDPNAHPFASTALLYRATDLLAALYEDLLTTASRQADRGRAFYMVSGHLECLVGHFQRFEKTLKMQENTGATPVFSQKRPLFLCQQTQN